MTVFELGAVGEFVGSIAVLATLIYLSVQLRQTRQSVQSAEKHNALASMNHITQNVAAHEGLAEIVHIGFVDPDSLNSVQWFRFGFFLTAMFHVFQQLYLDSEKGLIDPRIRAGEDRSMREALAMPGVDRWWRDFPSLPYSEEFQHYVDSILPSTQQTDQWKKLQESQHDSV